MRRHLPKLIEAATLYKEVNKSSNAGLRILDCTFAPSKSRPSPNEFLNNFYGKFEEQVKRDSSFQEDFYAFLTGARIPTSTYFSIPMATYPSDYEKFTYYPPKIFEQYSQLLGLNTDDHLVFYSRISDPLGALVTASRAYWLFKAYGHSGSLLNGGFNAWLHNKYPVSIGSEMDPPPVFHRNRGNWTAKTDPSTSTIKFEELAIVKNEVGNQRLLDSRSRSQFYDREPFSDPSRPQCSRLPGAINIPSTELISPDGKLRSSADIRALLKSSGLDIASLNGETLVTLCNSGMQASLLSTALDIQLGLDTVVYNGSMLEIRARAPELLIGEE